jgi:PAS domain S-box-containing protein
MPHRQHPASVLSEMFDPDVPALRRTPPDVAWLGNTALMNELALTFEELNVAEEELRTQNEELHRAHATLVSERERYRELFEHAPVAYLVTDVNGSIRDANRAAVKLFRCRRERLDGKPIVVFTQDVSRRRIRDAMRALGTSRECATVGLTVKARDNRIRRVEATVAVIRDVRGEQTGLRWLLVDRTRRIKRERTRRARAAELESLVVERTAELERAHAVKDQLIATVSHEFRTALSAIGGYAELLELGVRGPMTDLQAGDVRRIQNANRHLSRIVGDLLSYSRLATGKLVIDPEDVVLSDTMIGVPDLVAPQASSKGILLVIEAVDPAIVVHADPERVKQILLNVLGNAVKFTPRGGSVRVTFRPELEHVVVEVVDTGPGIPSDKLDSIFEPFVRLKRSAAEPGTGLGLSISRDLARAMGGELIAFSEEGAGSRFELRLPRSTRIAGR